MGVPPYARGDPSVTVLPPLDRSPPPHRAWYQRRLPRGGDQGSVRPGQGLGEKRGLKKCVLQADQGVGG